MAQRTIRLEARLTKDEKKVIDKLAEALERPAGWVMATYAVAAARVELERMEGEKK